jgi:hypothetical protein
LFFTTWRRLLQVERAILAGTIEPQRYYRTRMSECACACLKLNLLSKNLGWYECQKESLFYLKSSTTCHPTTVKRCSYCEKSQTLKYNQCASLCRAGRIILYCVVSIIYSCISSFVHELRTTTSRRGTLFLLLFFFFGQTVLCQ